MCCFIIIAAWSGNKSKNMGWNFCPRASAEKQAQKQVDEIGARGERRINHRELRQKHTEAIVSTQKE
jgi:hypothetical protein